MGTSTYPSAGDLIRKEDRPNMRSLLELASYPNMHPFAVDAFSVSSLGSGLPP